MRCYEIYKLLLPVHLPPFPVSSGPRGSMLSCRVFSFCVSKARCIRVVCIVLVKSRSPCHIDLSLHWLGCLKGEGEFVSRVTMKNVAMFDAF